MAPTSFAEYGDRPPRHPGGAAALHGHDIDQTGAR
jgi:hypothetical protein